jgi:transposase InsO family protein
LLGWSRSRYYAPPARPATVDATLAREVLRIHRRSRSSCGARTLSHGLRWVGLDVGRQGAATLMRQMSLTAKKKRFSHYRRNTKPAPVGNRLSRQFNPARPNQAWAGDITYIPTHQGWLYLAIVVDLFSRRIVGWATSTVADTRLALAASELAFATRQPEMGSSSTRIRAASTPPIATSPICKPMAPSRA